MLLCVCLLCCLCWLFLHKVACYCVCVCSAAPVLYETNFSARPFSLCLFAHCDDWFSSFGVPVRPLFVIIKVFAYANPTIGLAVFLGHCSCWVLYLSCPSAHRHSVSGGSTAACPRTVHHQGRQHRRGG